LDAPAFLISNLIYVGHQTYLSEFKNQNYNSANFSSNTSKVPEVLIPTIVLKKKKKKRTKFEKFPVNINVRHGINSQLLVLPFDCLFFDRNVDALTTTTYISYAPRTFSKVTVVVIFTPYI
jgi:hypothetical protein